MEPKIVFMGSPAFAIPALCMLASEYKVLGVITQPDRPAGRGKVMTPPPVKKIAESLGIPVIQPEKLKDPGALLSIASWNPDLIIVVAFGKILRQNWLDFPPFGCLNVHGSLLPRWRGASPIQAAVMNGDGKTGVTIMKMDAGVDTGPILSQAEIEISEQDSVEILSQRISEMGAGLLRETLPRYLSGNLCPVLQDASQATYAPILKKEDGLLTFDQSADALVRRVRGLQPWPGAFIILDGVAFKIHRAHSNTAAGAIPGQRSVIEKFPAIGTRSGWMILDEIQPSGKKIMPGDVFLRGTRTWVGS